MMAVAYKVPGVYREEDRHLSVEKFTGVPLFLGLTVKPTPQPIKLTLWTQFQIQVATPYKLQLHSYLSYAVRGFFENGGRVCYVHGLLDLGSLQKVLEDLETLAVVDLVCIPDLYVDASKRDELIQAQTKRDELIQAQTLVLQYCERMGDRFAILDAPNSTVQAMQKLRSTLDLMNANGAMYAPWIHVRDGPVFGSDPANQTEPQPIPPCGHIAGIYARVEREGGVHHAPANRVLEGVTKLSLTLSDADQAELNQNPKEYGFGINCLRVLPGRGIRIWGASTLSQDPLWRSIPVRRLFLTVARWIEQNMADISFEPNDFSLWIRVGRELTSYFESLYQQGALQGQTAEEAFYVKCDATTNPPNSRETGQVTAEIGLAPTLPNEFIVIRLIHGETGVMLES
jgi:hypothetical protein